MLFLETLTFDSPEARDQFTEFYNQYFYSVYAYSLKIIHETALAEDITHDTFLSVMSSEYNLNSPKVLSLLFVIARNKAFDLLRIRKREDYNEIDVFDRPSEFELSIPDQIIQSDQEKVLSKAIFMLREPYQSILRLRYYQDLKIREIAELLSLKESKVNSMLHRAKNQLRKIIEEDELL